MSDVPVDIFELELTPEELLIEAQSLAEEVMHVSALEAYHRVLAGEFEGTFFAARLHQIFFLLGDEFM